MELNFSTKTLEAQTIVGIRTKAQMAKLGEVMGQLFGELHGHIVQAGQVPAGMPLSIYHSMEAGEVDLECAIPVSGPVTGTDRIRPGELPAGRAATVTHHGPYENLKETWGALLAWVGAQGLQPAAAPWEVYVTDPGAEPDPSKWRTDIFFPVLG